MDSAMAFLFYDRGWENCFRAVPSRWGETDGTELVFYGSLDAEIFSSLKN